MIFLESAMLYFECTSSYHRSTKAKIIETTECRKVQMEKQISDLIIPSFYSQTDKHRHTHDYRDCMMTMATIELDPSKEKMNGKANGLRNTLFLSTTQREPSLIAVHRTCLSANMTEVVQQQQRDLCVPNFPHPPVCLV